MKKTTLKTALVGTLLISSFGLSQVAFAETTCTDAPKDQWMSELDAQKKIVGELNHVIYKFKQTDGNCYEIYGMGPKAEGSTDMEKVEIYFSPIDLSIVKRKQED